MDNNECNLNNGDCGQRNLLHGTALKVARMKVFIKIICYLMLIYAGLLKDFTAIIPITLVILSILAYIDIKAIYNDAWVKPVRRRKKKKAPQSRDAI